MNLKKITIEEYLRGKNIEFRESNGELVTKCLFNDCDGDSHGNERHLYFDKETGQYHCKKCDERGNILTLAKHLGDRVERQPKPKFNPLLVEKCHTALPPRIREYLNNRGISNEVIDEYQLGYTQLYQSYYISIPVKDEGGEFAFFKLREDPDYGKDKITFPKGSKINPVEAQLYDWKTLEQPIERLVICEGELDRLALISRGVTAITGTHGANTFKESWAKKIAENREIKSVYIAFDNDQAGRTGAQRVARLLEENGFTNIYIISLPDELGEHGDITDYLTRYNGSIDDLFSKFAKSHLEKIDVSDLKPITVEEIKETLALTIVGDEDNKVATFVTCACAFTDNDQLNISFNAPASTGKSHIAIEVVDYFPEESVMKIGYSSPAAFYHDTGEFDKENNVLTIDFERKIIVFIDMPHVDLLARLRPMLSHDQKEVMVKITDKSQRGGNRTKTVILRGYPSVVFCTAGMRMDEQESTRFILLSPEVDAEKIRRSINQSIRKSANRAEEVAKLESHPLRTLLKKRLRAIKQAHIRDINIRDFDQIETRFMASRNEHPRPRHQRDIKKLMAFIKGFALLNLWWRERNNETIYANQEDIDAGFKLWDSLAKSQELGVPPFALAIFGEVILPAWEALLKAETHFAPLGLTQLQILKKHHEVYGRHLSPNTLRQEIIPALEQGGLISKETDPNDRRNRLIRPVGEDEAEGNSEEEGGVN